MENSPEMNWLMVVLSIPLTLSYASGAWRTRPVRANPNARPGAFSHALMTALLALFVSVSSAIGAVAGDVPLHALPMHMVMAPLSVLILVGWAVTCAFAQRESLREDWLRNPGSATARLRRKYWYGLAAAFSVTICILSAGIYLLTSARAADKVMGMFAFPALWFGGVWIAYAFNARAVRAWSRSLPAQDAGREGLRL
jgi:hypothetical protein